MVRFTYIGILNKKVFKVYNRTDKKMSNSQP